MKTNKMCSLSLFSLLTVVLAQHLCWCDDGVQYSYKVTSNKTGDWFAYSLATLPKAIVVGAPEDNNHVGSVSIKPGTMLKPTDGKFFGRHVDANQHFIVATAEAPASISIFSSDPPYNLKVKIPLGVPFQVEDVVIAEDNTIAVATSHREHGFLTVYSYDTQASWHLSQKIDLPFFWSGSFISLAICNTTIAIAYRDVLVSLAGRVVVYRKEGDKLILTQTIKPPEHLYFFGVSMAMYRNHLAVSSNGAGDLRNIVYTYTLHPANRTWINNGRLLPPGQSRRSLSGRFNYVGIDKDVLAVTVTDGKLLDVCGVAYKLTERNSSSTGIRINESERDYHAGEFTWKQLATLKTDGEPLDPSNRNQHHYAVSVRNGTVFTGRVDRDKVGKVFAHNVSK